jgi:hypothetical protein
MMLQKNQKKIMANNGIPMAVIGLSDKIHASKLKKI